MRCSALLVLAFAMSMAEASPIIICGDSRSQSWTDAVSGGFVTPVTTALTTQTQTFYQDQVSNHGLNGFEQETPVLTPDFTVSDGSTTRDGMVMSWRQPQDQNTLGVSSWEWSYHADPDLTGLNLNFEALTPKGVFAIGVELIDINGLSKGWYRERPLPTKWDSSYMLNVSNGLQGPFTAFGEDTGFQLNSVMKIRFNEASLPSDPFVVDDPTGNGAAWNVWSYLDVVPEPSPLLAFGLVGVLAVCRRRKRQGPDSR